MDRRLRRSDLPVDIVALARFLIGKILVHDLRGAGWLVLSMATRCVTAGSEGFDSRI